jgi:formylglycine-generating enzyme required for sulfatase activity
MAKWHKTALVIIGAMVLSTVAIQAGDVFQGIRGNLAGSVVGSDSVCGTGAIQINLSDGGLCVDQYEASVAASCPQLDITSASQTQDNMNQAHCTSASAPDVMPWRFVSLNQAQQLCARSGKRLPTSAEWYALVVAQADQTTCVLNQSGPRYTGNVACKTTANINDMVGNVWEWTDGKVLDGQYAGRTLPSSGYVHLVDQEGIVIETDTVAAIEYGEDYAKTAPSGTYGIIRGGFYGSNADGGIFAQNLAVPLDLKTDGVGFRCVKSL